MAVNKVQWGKCLLLLYTAGTDKSTLHKGNIDNAFKVWVLPSEWQGVVFQDKSKVFPPLQSEEKKGEENNEEAEDDLKGWDK